MARPPASDRPEPPPGPPPEEKIEVSAVLPPDPRQRLEAVAGLYDDIRKQVAQVLQPVITALLKEAPRLDADQHAQLARQINHILAASQLAIIDPETGLPAKLKHDPPPPRSTVSTLRLRDTRTGEKGQHSVRVQDLDLDATPIQLVETDFPRSPRRPGKGS